MTRPIVYLIFLSISLVGCNRYEFSGKIDNEDFTGSWSREFSPQGGGGSNYYLTIDEDGGYVFESESRDSYGRRIDTYKEKGRVEIQGNVFKTEVKPNIKGRLRRSDNIIREYVIEVAPVRDSTYLGVPFGEYMFLRNERYQEWQFWQRD